MVNSMADELEKMLKQVGGLVNITIEEQEQVTEKGAEALKKSLVKATREQHYQPNRNTANVAHLADSITVGKLEGPGNKHDGSSAVGYRTNDVNHARIARFLNDGTKFIAGDSYHDRALEQAAPNAAKAQAKMLGDIQKEKVNKV